MSLTDLELYPINPALKLIPEMKDWRTWISGYNDPYRPVENEAFKRLRDRALLLEAIGRGLPVEFVIWLN